MSLPFRVVPLGCLGAAAVVSLLLGPAWSAGAGVVPWLIALVFVGLPHGAADLAVSRRLCGRRATLRLFAVYSALMGAVLAAFLCMPRPMVVLFGALSVWHFGLSHAHGQSPRLQTAWPWQAVAAVARGAGVLGMPLAVWPAETSASIAHLWALSSRAGMAAPLPFEPTNVRTVGICLLTAGITALAMEALASRHTPRALRRSFDTLVDLIVIGGLGAAADPLLSIGVYFLCWHAWREMRPLMRVIARSRRLAPQREAGVARLASEVAAVHVAALPLLVPTWVALAAAWWLLSPDHSAFDLAILSLGLYLVVTPSHEALGDLLGTDTAPGPWPLPKGTTPPGRITIGGRTSPPLARRHLIQWLLGEAPCGR